MNLKSFFRAIYLSFFYFSTLCFKVIDKNLFVLYFVCCSIFKDRFAPLVSSAHVVYHIIPTLSTPFSKLFSIFSKFFFLSTNIHFPTPKLCRFNNSDKKPPHLRRGGHSHI